MFENWSIRQITIIFLVSLLCIAVIQVILFIYNRSIYVHFGLSFLALFIALMLFHTVNIRLKRTKRR